MTKELCTYFEEVDGILDWRPLASVSSSGMDFDCLSPMHESVGLGSISVRSAQPYCEIRKLQKIMENVPTYGPRILGMMAKDLLTHVNSAEKMELSTGKL